MSRRPNALQIARLFAEARLSWKHPLYLVHSLTARCNARCGFCAWNPDFYDPREQLSTDAIKRLYSDARNAGFIGVSIWGGEPLLHPDFDEITRHARDEGLVTHMVTNGFLLERKMDAVVRNLDRICISLDHPSSAHDEMRGIRGLFDTIVRATRELRRRAPDKPVIFVYTLTKKSVDAAALREMAKLLADLGAVGVFNAMRHDPASDAPDSKIVDWAPSQPELSAAFDVLIDLKRRGYPIMNSHTHMRMMRAGPPVYRCHWPKLMLPIEANGDVVDCMHWGTRPVDNVTRTPLAEILKSPRLRALAGSTGEACHQCVSIHRVELSEVWDGHFEPVLSWRMLRKAAASRPHAKVRDARASARA